MKKRNNATARAVIKKSCEGCSHANGGGIPKEELNAYSDIKKVIGVVSGKGGVGKSFVTASLANEMASKGYRVGILDADITGPSIPRMYGIKGSATADDNGIYPILTKNDIENYVHQSASAAGGGSGHLERSDPCQHGKAVLDRCYMGRAGLSVRGYASGNRRCSADCVPVSAGGRYCHCVICPRIWCI